MPQPIIKGTVRILRPSEYEKLREGAEILDNQTRLDALLLTGLRFVEAERLHEHPDWVDGRFVHLPEYAQKKVKRKQRERCDAAASLEERGGERRHVPPDGTHSADARDRDPAAHAAPRSCRMKSMRALTDAKARFPTSSSGMET